MATINTADPQLVGLMLMTSRLVEQLLYAHATSASDQADLLARLHSDINGDIDAMKVPGSSDEVVEQLRNAARTVVGFTLSRVTFKPNA